MTRRYSLPLVVALIACASCSATHGNGADAGPDGPPFVPADHPPPLEFKNLGGPMLVHPSLVTVTWPGDPETDFVRRFDAWIAGSAFLKDGLAEYGIQAASYAGSFAFAAAAPATIDADDIGKSLADEAAAGRLPAPTPDRLYVVYTPPGTTVLRLGFKSCEAFAGTHTSLVVAGAAAPIVYSIVPRCHFDGSTDEDALTFSSSHEITEAITDPIFDHPAWFTTDPTVSTGAEVADACISPARVEGYKLNQLYSTIAAHAGERPCRPSPPGPACGLWADKPELFIPRGGSAETTVHVWFGAPTNPNFSLLLGGHPALTTLVEPTGVNQVFNGATLRVRVTMPATTPDFVDDIVPMSLYCGDEGYVSWYYVHAKLPPL